MSKTESVTVIICALLAAGVLALAIFKGTECSRISDEQKFKQYQLEIERFGDKLPERPIR